MRRSLCVKLNVDSMHVKVTWARNSMPQRACGVQVCRDIVVCMHAAQACATYGPQKLFLRSARALSIVENVAKARPRMIVVPEFLNFFQTTTNYLHGYEIDFCGPRHIYVDDLVLRTFWVVQAWCRDILQWWREDRLEFPDLSDLARNA